MKPNTFAVRLRSLRESAGLSVAGLAGRIEVDRQLVYLWEAGKCQPRFSTAFKLARALGVTVEELCAG